MKRIFIFSICVSIMTLSANGQSETLKNVLGGRKAGVISFPTRTENVDTTHEKTKSDGQELAIYINGNFFGPILLSTIDPMQIDDMNIEKKEIELQGRKYYAQVFLKMKGDYNPKMISLVDLYKKYTNNQNGLTLLMIDNYLQKDSFDDYYVDENNLIIIVDSVKKDEQNIKLVRLWTKSEKNIEMLKEIRLFKTIEEYNKRH